MATGIYHKTNVLKMRIMLTVYNADFPLTCSEIADTTGSSLINVSTAMHHYRAKKCGYFRRLKPIKGKAYRYKITKKGTKYLELYCWRLHRGFDLSLGSRKIKTMPKYERLKAERQAEFESSQAEFEHTGIQQPEKPKPTLAELLNFDPTDLADYIGITKYGMLEMGIVGIDFD